MSFLARLRLPAPRDLIGPYRSVVPLSPGSTSQKFWIACRCVLRLNVLLKLFDFIFANFFFWSYFVFSLCLFLGIEFLIIFPSFHSGQAKSSTQWVSHFSTTVSSCSVLRLLVLHFSLSCMADRMDALCSFFFLQRMARRIAGYVSRALFS